MSRSPGPRERNIGEDSLNEYATTPVVEAENAGIDRQMRVLSLEAKVADLRAERERHLDTIERLEDEVARLDAERTVLISDLDHREAQISQIVETYERIIDEQSQDSGPEGRLSRLRTTLWRFVRTAK